MGSCSFLLANKSWFLAVLRFMFSITHWLQTSYLSSLLLSKDLSRALTNTLLKERVPWTRYQPLPLSVSFGRKGDVSDTSPWRGVNWAERPRVHIKSQGDWKFIVYKPHKCGIIWEVSIIQRQTECWALSFSAQMPQQSGSLYEEWDSFDYINARAIKY